MPRMLPGSGVAKNGEAKPVRSPDERNLLQFSPFVGLEEGSLSPGGRFCRVKTKKSGSNAPQMFRALYSNDLSQTGSMDSQDEDCKNEAAVGEKDHSIENELPGPRDVSETHDDSKPSSSSMKKKGTLRGSETHLLQFKAGSYNSSSSERKMKASGVGIRESRPCEVSPPHSLKTDRQSTFEPPLNSNPLHTEESKKPSHEQRQWEIEQRLRRFADCADPSGTSMGKSSKEVWMQETEADCLTEQKGPRFVADGDDVSFTKIASRMIKMIPKSSSRERIETKPRTSKDNESNRPVVTGSLRRRLTPRITPLSKAIRSVPDLEENLNNNPRRNRSSMNCLPPQSRPLRLSRSLDIELESKENVISSSPKVSPSSSDNGELRKIVLSKPSRSSKDGNSPLGELGPNSLVAKRNSLRDRFQRKSGPSRHSPSTQVAPRDKTGQLTKGTFPGRQGPFRNGDPLSEKKTPKGTMSLLQRYSPIRAEKKVQSENKRHKRPSQETRLSPKSSTEGTNSTRSPDRNSAREIPISDEDYAKRSVEIEKFLNTVTDT